MVESFISSIIHDGERYEVPLPRKDIHDCLPENLGIAKQRLENLRKRLDQKPKIMRKYDEYFNDQLENGIIEKVSDSDCGDVGWTHYLPHHCVIREYKETTKLRVVFYASCSVRGSPSLNRCLDAGPSLNPELFDILLHFRLFPIALIADIEKAFLMISVRPEDRNVLRFLWVDLNHPGKIVVFRQTRVTFGLNTSPFILTATIRNHLSKYVDKEKETVDTMDNSLYVDDLCAGGFDEKGTLAFYSKAKSIMGDGCFNLRKWRSNSKAVGTEICKNEGAKLSDDGKVLGIPWNSDTDMLKFDLGEFSRKFSGIKVTKRNVVSVIAQLFDPLGLLTPIVITAKVLLQKIHKADGEWDTMVKGSLACEWGKWLVMLVEIEAVINCRPLTYIGADDVEESLTPSHLVCEKRIIGLPTGEVRLGLLDSYCHIRKVLSDAKERWVKEYLTELRCHHQQRKIGNAQCLMVGDLVLIKEDKKRRHLWKVGKINKLILGRKDIVRGAIVSLGDGKQNIRRPLELLYPLEARGWGSFTLSGKPKTDHERPHEKRITK